jgi:hypothetical protein
MAGKSSRGFKEENGAGSMPAGGASRDIPDFGAALFITAFTNG